MAIVAGIAALTVFPLPFGLLAVGLPNAILISACFIYISRPRWRADPTLWEDVKRQLSVYNCLVALTFIYPIYIFGFVSLTGVYQAMFVMILPIVPIVAKNRISRQHTDNDRKPESVLFIVEILNALYITNALNNS
ncbi:uncharacterized protein PITG_21259 [Phytophthora infestans T30-4]|uniref:Uncharacterized protein n=1 Tax=Phytophthora infestans (strain T30-4) TaxID=403677 RepID=D0P3Y7_PHYIT|nr:uncharacterized protein PITG_21259 [Phytophthora infestans T30-4]EEY62123.1 conserved hypothetical protein [Phytophthora infestans T30-4]|eukprot:XP_002894988.1 conserved hypothetical protein [Phytophthora infestans T30-4]